MLEASCGAWARLEASEVVGLVRPEFGKLMSSLLIACMPTDPIPGNIAALRASSPLILLVAVPYKQ